MLLAEVLANCCIPFFKLLIYTLFTFILGPADFFLVTLKRFLLVIAELEE
jgi:hypothetical protein